MATESGDCGPQKCIFLDLIEAGLLFLVLNYQFASYSEGWAAGEVRATFKPDFGRLDLEREEFPWNIRWF
jgi:hypothetical protein